MSSRTLPSRSTSPRLRPALGIERLEHRFPFDTAAAETGFWEQDSVLVGEQLPHAGLSDSVEGNLTERLLGMKLTLEAPIDGIDSPETTVAGIGSSENSEADSAAFADGSHMLAFAGDIAGNDGLFVRRTQPDGSPGDLPTAVALFASGDLRSPESKIRVALAALQTGNSVVAWTDSTAIHLQQLDASNSLRGPRIDFAVTTTPASFEIDLVAVEDGGWMLAWNENEATTIQAQRFDLDGQITGQPMTIASTSPTSQIDDLQWISHSGDEFGISWTEWSTDPTEQSEQQFLGVLEADGTWANDPFEITSDSFSPTPELAALDDGRWVLAGTRWSEPQSYPAIIVVDATGNLISEHALDASADIGAAPVALTKLAGGGFAIGYFRGESESDPEFVVEQFNDDAEPIADPIVMNQTALHGEPAGSMVGLANGGIATYWIGTAADQTSPAILSRTVSMESARVNIAFDSFVSLAEADSLSITGVPAEAALSHGVRTSPTSWTVSINDLDDLRILSIEPLPTITLTADLLTPDTLQPPLASWAITIGTPTDDTIEQYNSAYVVDGRDGEDTFVAAGDREEFLLDTTDLGKAVRLIHMQTGTEQLLIDVEYLVFDDLFLDIEQWVEAAEEPSQEADGNDAPEPNLEFQASMAQANFNIFSTKPPPLAAAQANMPTGLRSVDVMQAAMNAVAVELETAMGMELQGVMQGMERSIRNMNEPARVVQSKQASNEAKSRASESKAKPTDALKSETQPTLAAGVAGPDFTAAIDDVGLADPLVVPNFVPLQPAHPIQPQAAAIASHNNPVASARTLYRISGQTAPAVAPILIPKAPPAPPPEFLPIAPVSMPFTSSMLDMSTAFDSQQLFAQIDTVQQEVVEDAESIELVAGSAVVLATGMSIAQVAWLLRGSVLLTKLMSSMPIWVSFDPLPVLSESWNRVAMDSSGDSETLLDIASVQDPVGPLQ
ncbi:hypothetical protein EC9_15260 [Rosistilla ulvae]|uniref:Uncharacterized protein n=1 Tax=Rosistilla ulvae TaxID=1930277 RepID=A0A517LXJ4_9BACT|nr:hypothetical protein [Rosistilla ulvae]QDS87348.1 hypothetical protein EC9_15260 [Rosistilla ulvae]